VSELTDKHEPPEVIKSREIVQQEEQDNEQPGFEEDGPARWSERGDVITPRDLYESPIKMAHERASELQGQLGDASRGYATIAVGVLEGKDGKRELAVASNATNKSGDAYLRQELWDAMSPAQLTSNIEFVVPGTSVHAEQKIVDYARENGQKVVAVGAGRPVCDECVKAIEGADGIVASPKKRGND
jgi:hypothetical protein